MSDNRLAFLIGNQSYDSQDLPDLRQPLADIDRMADVLSKYGDFQIVDKLSDESSGFIKERIEEFYQNAVRGDLTLFYYSGHGLQDNDGQLYLTGRNTKENLIRSTGISELFLQGVLGESKANHKVIILDCCFSGRFSIGGKSQHGDSEVRFEALQGEEAVVIASSGRVQQSFESDLLNSWFTQFIADGIETSDADQNGDGDITVDELFSYAAPKVKELVPNQTPVLRTERRDSQIVIAKGLDRSQQAIYMIHSESEPDKFFVDWLTVKLQQEGYPTWRYRAVRGDDLPSSQRLFGAYTSVFLFVQSNQSEHDDQVNREIAQLKKRQSTSSQSIIGLILEGSDPSRSSSNLTTIDFRDNWASGLTELKLQLKSKQVPKLKASHEELITFWTASRNYPQGILLSDAERYRSNWFPVELPPHVYLFKMSLFQLNNLNLSDLEYPIVMLGEVLITFACPECVAGIINYEECKRIETAQFISESKYDWKDIDVVVDQPNHKIIDLLNQGIDRLFQFESWRSYELSKGIAYYSPEFNEASYVSLKRVGGNRTKLSGRRKDHTWYYAVDARAFLHPLPSYFLRGHVIFSRKGHLLNTKKQHKQRRSLGREWHNKIWRDKLLGVTMRLLGGRSTMCIPLPVCCSQSINMSANPLDFESPVGYLEPTKSI